jgi:hypothetical protein
MVTPTPSPAPGELPKPVNPEPHQEKSTDPEKGHVPVPPPGKSDHPKQ